MSKITKINDTTYERIIEVKYYTNFPISLKQFINKPELIKELSKVNNNINLLDSISVFIEAHYIEQIKEYEIDVNELNKLYLLCHKHRETIKWDKGDLQKLTHEYDFNYNDYVYRMSDSIVNTIVYVKNTKHLFNDSNKLEILKNRFMESKIGKIKNSNITYSSQKIETSYDNLYFLFLILVIDEPLYFVINGIDVAIIDQSSLWNYIGTKSSITIIKLERLKQCLLLDNNETLLNQIEERKKEYNSENTKTIMDRCKKYIKDKRIKKFTLEKHNNFRILKPTMWYERWDKVSITMIKEWNKTFSETLYKRHWWFEYTEFTPTIRIWKKERDEEK